MSTVHVMKTASGALMPASPLDAAALQRFKAGSVVRGEFTEMRNGVFFRKWWVLAQFAFDIWKETTPAQTFHGREVLPDFERFRKDLTIMAGFFRPVWNARQQMRIEPESISWAKMPPERFEQLYSATINAILQKIIPNAGYDDARLRATVDQLLTGFD